MINKNKVKEYEKVMSLYIHIPFCVSKCSYCNFCSFPKKEEFHISYVKKLCEELCLKAEEFKNYKISSIYIGGGTPSVLPAKEITKILDTVKKSFNLVENISITIEGNPNSLTLEKLKEYKQCGVNRLSVGLQSANSQILKLLNRPHNVEDFLTCIKNAKSVGFENINADMIIGVPTQTMEDVKNTIELLVSQDLKHISSYGLILERGTNLYKMVKAKKLKPLDDELCNQMYDYVYSYLKENGFNRYEISNFSKPGFESVHNLNYWKRGQYLGIGLDAYSFVDGIHWQNTNVLEDYLQGCTKKLKKEIETTYTAKLETIMLGLRLDKGLDIKKFNDDFKTDFLKEYDFVLKKLLENNCVKIEDNHLIVITPNISNLIIAEFA